MKICFYTDSIFTFVGVQRVLAVLAKELSMTHEITILTLDDPSLMDLSMYNLSGANIEHNFVKFYKYPFCEYIPSKFFSFLYKTILPQNKLFSKWYGYSSFPRCKRRFLIDFLNRGNYDIVVRVHVFLSMYLASIKNKLSARVIGGMHNSYDTFFAIKNPYIGKLKNYFQYMMPSLDKIVVLTFYDQKMYVKKLKLIIPPVVIYNPLTVVPDMEEPQKYKIFLAVGRLSHQTKGFDILIQAFALFAKKNKDWILNIVGEGPEKPFLDYLIERNNLAGRVTIKPFTKDIEKYYKESSVFVLSSRWEGMPLVLLEAMTFGLPIICSDLPTVKELQCQKNVAIFFKNENINDLSEKMQEIVDMPEDMCLNMRLNACHYAKNLSLDKIGLQWEDLFYSIKVNDSNFS